MNQEYADILAFYFIAFMKVMKIEEVEFATFHPFLWCIVSMIYILITTYN